MNACRPPIAWHLLAWVLLVVLASGAKALGQGREVSTSTIPILDTVINSWPVDATMTREQERAIWERLCKPYTPIDARIPLDRWVDSVAPLCLIEIDEYSLKGIGISEDTELSFRVDTPQRPLLVHALSALESLECVIEIRHGVVWITTQDSADEHLPVRIYDISMLMGARGQHEQVIAMKYLMETIQYVIEPDGWEVLGGTSVIKIFPMKRRPLLCVATRTQTHWQLQAFLDQLQRAGGESPESDAPRRVVSGIPPDEPSAALESPERSWREGRGLPRFRPQ